MRRLPRELYNILRVKGFTDFEMRVYDKVCAINWGQTESYKWVAKEIGSPKAHRAVGQALKKNPFPFIIPCHRVIREDGTIGGFAGGKTVKKRLLEQEKADIISG